VARIGVPCFGWLTGGPRLVFLNVAWAGLVNGCTVSNPTRYQTVFYILQNKSNYKLEKTPLYCSKNYQIFHVDRLEDKEQLSFWNKVQIQNIILIKNPRSRTVFELDLSLLGIQTCLKISNKFPKISICLRFP
jgi:hypothetical protein